ncbi:TD and POZ domain-containing protein 4-like [Dendronephthya gigantea]|uniref:TD and POZ domain-containing protein 4-like n=1 Tax=Dendronephthya gigantea TaxID=151771 RepID=UPI001069BC36|nr:TD and POZ domain-containing protein 4-like [Dendronephthya gigantea]
MESNSNTTTDDKQVQATTSVDAFNDNVFSKSWNNSDVVLLVDGEEFHVHRSILSLQSPVFHAMFNGNFKDATQDKIELKDDMNHKAMLQFLILLYPSNMLDEVKGSVSITDENVFEILQLADKYGAINIIKQCMKEAGRLKPENTMRLLPYAVRNELPLEKIYDVIARHVSTEKLGSFAPEIGKESVHIEALDKKCRLYEDVLKRANTAIHHLLQIHLDFKTGSRRFETSVRCVQHTPLGVRDFEKARKCENCLKIYKSCFIDEYIYPVSRSGIGGTPKPPTNDSKSADFIDLLQITDDIAISLEK